MYFFISKFIPTLIPNLSTPTKGASLLSIPTDYCEGITVECNNIKYYIDVNYEFTFLNWLHTVPFGFLDQYKQVKLKIRV